MTRSGWVNAAYAVAVRESEAHAELRLRRRVRGDHPGEDISEGMRALAGCAAEAGLRVCGPPATTYLTPFGPGRDTEVEFSVPVDSGAAAEVVVRPPALVAVARHRGDYRTIGAAYAAVDDWVRASRYRAAGPPTELYLVGPDQTADPRELVTEIRVPVVPDPVLTARLAVPVTEAVARVREALRHRGFDVLAEVGAGAGLRLGDEVEDHVVLVARHPELAREAWGIDRRASVLLPCTVVVRAEDGGSVVDVADPEVLPRAAALPALVPVAARTRRAVVAVLASLGPA